MIDSMAFLWPGQPQMTPTNHGGCAGPMQGYGSIVRPAGGWASWQHSEQLVPPETWMQDVQVVLLSPTSNKA